MDMKIEMCVLKSLAAMTRGFNNPYNYKYFGTEFSEFHENIEGQLIYFKRFSCDFCMTK